jgi:hypothetical protein
MGERVDTNAAQTKDTSVLRILSYLPNPRLAKATIGARLCGVRLEVRGAALKDLQEWVWDFDAHPLTEAERESSKRLERAAKTGYTGRLYKTERFLDAHPFGTVPAAFSPDGRVGIFESNSVMRAVARLGSDRVPLYGHDAYGASRIDRKDAAGRSADRAPSSTSGRFARWPQTGSRRGPSPRRLASPTTRCAGFSAAARKPPLPTPLQTVMIPRAPLWNPGASKAEGSHAAATSICLLRFSAWSPPPDVASRTFTY